MGKEQKINKFQEGYSQFLEGIRLAQESGRRNVIKPLADVGHPKHPGRFVLETVDGNQATLLAPTAYTGKKVAERIVVPRGEIFLIADTLTCMIGLKHEVPRGAIRRVLNAPNN